MGKDMKEALGARSKPDLSHVRKVFAVYAARPCEYGSAKYQRANYLRPTGDGPADTAANVERARVYAGATLRHIFAWLDSLEQHQASDPNFEDRAATERAFYAADEDAGLNFPASSLPHLAHAVASLQMLIAQAADAGLLPDDPGRPWREPVSASSADTKPGDDA